MSKRAIALATGVLLVLTACGGDDEAAARQAIAESLASDEGLSMIQAQSEEDAECIADGVVDGIGVEPLREYGVLDEDNNVTTDLGNVTLTREDATVLTDTLFECTDVKDLMGQALAGDFGGASQELTKCLSESFDEATLRPIFIGLFSDDPAAASQGLLGVLGECDPSLLNPTP